MINPTDHSRGEGASVAEPSDPVVLVERLTKIFHARKGGAAAVAVDDVSFTVRRGTTFGIVGESGSGKTTLARCIVGLTPVDTGRVQILGHDIVGTNRRALRHWRKDFQLVFQEPYESLDPRMRVAAAIAEPLRLHTRLGKSEIAARVDQALGQVGLPTDLALRRPNQISGGQQQRVNIARALITSPRLVVLDEPTSSLDVSVRSEILRLLVRLQRQLSLSYVLISHDLRTVRALCDEVAVMYRGRIVEIGDSETLLTNAQHPYTRLLVNSELSLTPGMIRPPLAAATRTAPPNREACVFLARCPVAVEQCARQPALASTEPNHSVACVHAAPRSDGKASHAQTGVAW